MQNRVYKVGELRRVIKESTSEFEPVKFNDDNGEINREVYKEMADASQVGYIRKKDANPKYPYTDNKGQEDLRIDNIAPEYAKNQKARREGYVDDQAKRLHKDDPYGNADFHEIDGIEDHVKAIEKAESARTEMGLTSRELPKKELHSYRSGKTVDTVKENKVMQLTFKNTVFLTEEHMLSRVPDNYKVEGKRFVMKDKDNHEYLVEWHNEDDPKVVNKTRIVETNNRIKELFNYKRADSNTTNEIRAKEGNKVNEMIDKARKLMK